MDLSHLIYFSSFTESSHLQVLAWLAARLLYVQILDPWKTGEGNLKLVQKTSTNGKNIVVLLET